MEKLYHIQVYIPDELLGSSKELLDRDAHISNHIFKRISDTMLSKYNRGFTIDELRWLISEMIYDDADPFEVASEDGVTATKAVFRTKYDDYFDISIVVRKNVIVTAWLNMVDDNHYTLDKTKYERK